LNRRKIYMLWTVSLLLLFTLSACQKGTPSANNDKQNASSSANTQAASSEAATETDSLPDMVNLSAVVKGNQVEQTARLTQAKGYAFYVPEGFTFDKDNNKLLLQSDPTYFATIYKLPADYKMEYLKFEADQEMSDVGRVKELQGTDVPESMRDADLFMVGTGSKRIKQYIVKTFNGQGYVLRLEIPVGETADEFAPLAYASLNSIVDQP
jgi:hypothetical protein